MTNNYARICRAGGAPSVDLYRSPPCHLLRGQIGQCAGGSSGAVGPSTWQLDPTLFYFVVTYEQHSAVYKMPSICVRFDPSCCGIECDLRLILKKSVHVGVPGRGSLDWEVNFSTIVERPFRGRDWYYCSAPFGGASRTLFSGPLGAVQGYLVARLRLALARVIFWGLRPLGCT